MPEYAQFNLEDGKKVAKATSIVLKQRPSIQPDAWRGGQMPYITYVMLLEDIPSDEIGKATVLTPYFDYHKHVITVNGDPSDNGTFLIRWSDRTTGTGSLSNPEDVTGISAWSTPEELRLKLLEFSFLSSGDIREIQLGNHERNVSHIVDGVDSFVYQPLRWIVCLNRELPEMEPSIQGGSSTSWMSGCRTWLQDSGETIDVYSGLPTGRPTNGATILRAGALAVAAPLATGGWALLTLEPRILDY